MSTSSGIPAARVAVLIDCDNVSWQRAAAIISEAATHGVLGIKRGYGDWGSSFLTGWRQQLIALAIQPVQQIAYVPGKGATDIALVIDAMDLLHSGQVDTFCLVASDSDYTRLAMRLREAGRRVVGNRRSKADPGSIQQRMQPVHIRRGARSHGRPAGDSAEAVTQLPDSETDAPSHHADTSPPGATTAGDLPTLDEMLTAAVLARQDEDGWALLSNVGFQLVASHPSFDSRNYGYSRLGQLARDQAYLEVRDAPGPSGNSVLHVRVQDIEPAEVGLKSAPPED